MKYSYNKLEQDIINKPLKPIFLLYGEEQYLIELLLKKVKKKFGVLHKGINYITMDEENIELLASEMEVPTFSNERKLIVVRHSHLFLPTNYKPKKDEIKKEWKSIREQISQYIDKNIDIVTENAVIVFIENEISTNALYEVIEKHGATYKSDYLKPQELVQRLVKICSMYKVNTTNTTMQHLIETSGINLMDLINEIRKLIEYVGAGGTITEKDIDLLSTRTMESMIYELTESMGMKKTEKSLEEFNTILHEYTDILKYDNPAQPILISIYKHFKKLYLCQLAIECNKDIATTLNLKPNQVWLVNKYKQQVALFQTNIRLMLQDLIDLDYKAKTNQIDLVLGIECIICKYC